MFDVSRALIFRSSQGDKSTLYSTNQGELDYGGGEEAQAQPIVTSYSIDTDGNLAYSGAVYANSDNLDSFGSGDWVGVNPASPYEVHLVSIVHVLVVKCTVLCLTLHGLLNVFANS